jgi:CubicO group peptidase (beta-lactamase class C family)
LVALCGLVLVTACSDSAEPTADRELDAAMTAVEESGIDAVVAYSRGGGPIAVAEFGSFLDDDVAPGDVLVDIGSVTKTVTGVLVARAVDDGLLRLDETVGDVFPSAPPDKAGITILQLLTHDAGLPESVGDDAEALSRDAFLRRVLDTPLEGAPGEGYDYSNVGFGVLAAVLEERTGRSYDEYLQVILAGAPVGDIGYDTVYEEARSARAADGRSVREASWGGHAASWNLTGNGGLVASPAAIVELRRAVTGGRLLSDEMTRATQRPYVSEDDGATSAYGFGVVVDELPDAGAVYWHDGGNGVFSAIWWEVPDRGDVFFVASVDSEQGDALAVADLLTEALYPPEG